MQLVAVKSEEKQASAVIFRTRDVLIGQRTQLINAIYGHLPELGFIAPQGPFHILQLIMRIEGRSSTIPEAARFGPLIAPALEAMVPPAETFLSGRGFAVSGVLLPRCPRRCDL